MNKKIVVLGSVNVDHVLMLENFPRPGETTTGSSYQTVSGGKGANQAVACARLGGETYFLACVGEDSFGREVVRQFESDGINTVAVTEMPDANTGVALIFVDSHAENCIGISAEANAHLDEAYVKRYHALIENSDYLLMQLETPESGVMAAATLARAAGATVILNPAPARPLSDELLGHIDIITPNQTEAEMLTGVAVTDHFSAAQAANVLHYKGIGIVVITMGSQGAFVSERQDYGIRREMVQGFRVQPVDTTAAGDTFNGGFVVALAEGRDIIDAIAFANGCGALSVMQYGAQTSIPVRADVEKFLSIRFGKLEC